jgi:hypothetical protein
MKAGLKQVPFTGALPGPCLSLSLCRGHDQEEETRPSLDVIPADATPSAEVPEHCEFRLAFEALRSASGAEVCCRGAFVAEAQAAFPADAGLAVQALHHVRREQAVADAIAERPDEPLEVHSDSSVGHQAYSVPGSAAAFPDGPLEARSCNSGARREGSAADFPAAYPDWPRVDAAHCA